MVGRNQKRKPKRKKKKKITEKKNPCMQRDRRYLLNPVHWSQLQGKLRRQTGVRTVLELVLWHTWNQQLLLLMAILLNLPRYYTDVVLCAMWLGV